MDESKFERHEREILRRMAWCIHNDKTPANEHLHLAPGDDSNFFYGVPPWNPDGTPNAAGIPCTGQSEHETAQAKAQRYDPNAGWNCHSCNEWVPIPPRKYVGPKEPWDWWFCRECREKKTKPSKKIIDQQRIATKNHKITAWLGNKKQKIDN